MRMVIDIGVSTVASDMEEEGKSDVGGGNREEAERRGRDQTSDTISMRTSGGFLDPGGNTHNNASPKIRMIAPRALVVPVLLPNPIPVIATATIQNTASMQFRMEYALRLPNRRNFGIRSVQISYASTTRDLTDCVTPGRLFSGDFDRLSAR